MHKWCRVPIKARSSRVNMINDELYNQRLTRILKAVALETPDRTPVVLEYSGFAAYVTRTSMAEFLRSPTTNMDTMIQAFHIVGDGDTDIFRAKEVLGDHMCLMGDVPASMLFYKSSEDVYKYCFRLIRELGPTGFILQSGCDIPANAKLENVQAMVAAAVG